MLGLEGGEGSATHLRSSALASKGSPSEGRSGGRGGEAAASDQGCDPAFVATLLVARSVGSLGVRRRSIARPDPQGRSLPKYPQGRRITNPSVPLLQPDVQDMFERKPVLSAYQRRLPGQMYGL